MKYLIDTDITSYYLRGKYNLDEIFHRKGIHLLRISIITVAELEVLALKNPQSKINLSTIEAFSGMLGIVDANKETWELFSKMKAQTLSKGMSRGDFDILNAAIARQHKLILVTRNVTHYKDLVEVENWIE